MTLVVFVHPFWLMHEFLPWYTPCLEELRSNPAYGSYATYGRNMRRLHQTLKRNATPSAFILPFEHRGMNRVPWSTRGPAFPPLKGSVVLEWTPKLGGYCSYASVRQRRGRYVVDSAFSRLDDITDILAGRSDDIALCGEMGPYERSSTGCIGAVVQALQGKTRVTGIEGCVFPIVPYETRFRQTDDVLSPERMRAAASELREVTRVLYEDCRSVDEIIRLSRRQREKNVRYIKE
ncbi:hypothetical protein HY642_06240 [Candidatus Woesearchaeota archaeon]|nr:hypothetical protein [Candidatus Woesearchaeota archaeon]